MDLLAHRMSGVHPRRFSVSAGLDPLLKYFFWWHLLSAADEINRAELSFAMGCNPTGESAVWAGEQGLALDVDLKLFTSHLHSRGSSVVQVFQADVPIPRCAHLFLPP